MEGFGTSSNFAGSHVTVQQLKLQSLACEAQHSVSYVGGSIRFHALDDINPALPRIIKEYTTIPID